MRVGWRVLGVAGVSTALFLAGCAPQFDRIETGVLRNGEALERLQREQQLMRQEVEGIQALLRLDQESGLTADARGTAKLGLLSQRIDQLIQKLDDNAAFMRTLSARVDLLATRAGIPTLGEVKSLPGPESQDGELPEEGRTVFQAARRDRDLGNADLARQGFQDFLARYPRSELADDALYYLGDLALAAGEHQEALAHFRAMLEQFPASELAPSALLKVGTSLLEIGQKPAGRARLEELIARYPESEEAALARERLADKQ